MVKPRIMFLGERRIAQSCLQALSKSAMLQYVEIPVLVTSNGFARGARDSFPFLEQSRVIDNSVRNEKLLIEAIESDEITGLISVQHPWVLSSTLLNAVDERALNIHNAALPDYKGFNSISHAIIDGRSVVHTTLHWMAAAVDEGDVVAEERTSVTSRDTAESVYLRTIPRAAKLFLKALEGFMGSSLPRRPVSGVGKYYSRRDLDTFRNLTNERDATRFDRVVRGCFFPPYEPAFVEIGGERYYQLPPSAIEEKIFRVQGANACSW